jgi:hypothetical protein
MSVKRNEHGYLVNDEGRRVCDICQREDHLARIHLKINGMEELEIYTRNQLGSKVITTLRGPASISITKKQQGSGRVLVLEDAEGHNENPMD